MTKAEQKRLAKRQEEDLRVLANTDEGRRFLLRLFHAAGVYRSTFSPNNTHTSAWLEGQRSVGLTILSWLNEVDPNIYLHLVQTNAEQLTRERYNRNRNASSRDDDGNSTDND